MLKNPDEIDEGWDGLGYRCEKSKPGQVIRILNAGSVITALAVNPLLGLAVSVAASIPIAVSELSYDENYKKKRTGWTMLEFAAEEGRSEVGAYLIMCGADTNNNYRKIAEANGHKNFLTICDEALEKAAKSIEYKNTNTQLNMQLNLVKKQNDLLKLKLIKRKVKLIELRNDFDKLHQTFEMLISEDDKEDEIDLEAIYENLKEMYDNLSKMEEIIAYVGDMTHSIDDDVENKAKEVLDFVNDKYNSAMLNYNEASARYKELPEMQPDDEADATNESIDALDKLEKDFDRLRLRANFNDLYEDSAAKIKNDEIDNDDLLPLLYENLIGMYELVNKMGVFAKKVDKSDDINDQYEISLAYYKVCLENYEKVFKIVYQEVKVDDLRKLNTKAMHSLGFFAKYKDKDSFIFGMKDMKVPFIAGDCFYDAVIASRPDRRWNKLKLRQAISNDMLTNSSDYRNFLIPGFGRIRISNSEYYTYNNYDEYCKLVAKDKVSADNIEIISFCKLHKVACVVVDSEVDFANIYGSEHISDDNPPIFLGYIPKQMHYVALKLPSNRDWNATLDLLKSTDRICDLQDNGNKSRKEGAAYAT